MRPVPHPMPTIRTTHLEMTDPSRLRGRAIPDPRLRVLEATVPEGRLNRFLYTLVGADWSWRDKLVWSDDEWRAYAEDERLRTFVAYFDGTPAGYYELLRAGEETQVAYFGLVPRFIGRGFGGALLTHALGTAWSAGSKRVWVHTCTRDHPAALANYLARGMTVFHVEEHESP